MTKVSKKKEKKSKDKKKVEVIKERSKTAPHKGTNLDAWTEWYKETIKEMVSKGMTINEISKELSIREDSVKAFIS